MAKARTDAPLRREAHRVEPVPRPELRMARSKAELVRTVAAIYFILVQTALVLRVYGIT